MVLGVYAQLRGRMDNMGMPVHGKEWETTLFGGLPTVWLQDHLWTLAREELEWTAVIVHGSWFFLPPLAGLLVSFRRPDRIGSFFRWWIALELLALPLWALFPMQPPWMASDEVTRIIALRFGGEIQDSNALAAMPSMHVAFPLLLAIWFQREKWTAPAIAMYGCAGIIAFEVVFSGEHYVIDVLGAAVLCLAITFASRIKVKMPAFFVSSPDSGRSFAQAGRLQPALEPVAPSLQGERGQALIEFALLLPLLLVFILVLVDFGVAIDRRQVLQHAVRDGARYGSIGTYSEGEIKAKVVDSAIDLIQADDVDVCYIDADGNGNPANAGDSLRVTAHFQYRFSVGGGEMLGAFGIPAPTIDMDPSAVMRLESSVTSSPPPAACPP